MLFKKTIPQRAVIHSRDVENITGRKGRTAQTILQNIRKAFGKQKYQFVTVSEFCQFTGIDEPTVRQYIQD
jgi:predicted RNA-binding protein YlqC (UPF0109 family)